MWSPLRSSPQTRFCATRAMGMRASHVLPGVVGSPRSRSRAMARERGGKAMKRKVYYVLPVGSVWEVRGSEPSAESFPTFEDALGAAGKLIASGYVVRFIGRADARQRPSLPGAPTS